MAIEESTIGLLFRIKAETDDANKKIDETGDKTDRLNKLFSKIGDSDVASKLAGIASTAGGAAVGIGAVVTVAAAGATALFNLAKTASDFVGDISDASQKTGLMVETMSALKFGADAFGSSFEEVGGAVTKFTKLIGEAANGSDEATAKLEKLGVDPKKAVNDLEGAFAQAVKKIYELPPGVQQSNAAMAAFGKTGANLIPFINSFDGDMSKLIATAKDLGVTLTDEDAAAADEFGDQLEILKAQSQGVATQFAIGFMPAITTAMKEISGAAADNKAVWRDWGENVGYVLLRFVRGVRVAAAAAKDLFSGDYSATNTLAALQINADAYENDRREKVVRDNLNDPNRPDWLKKQDKDVDNLNNQNTESFVGAGGGKSKDKNSTKNWSLTKVLEAMRKGTMGQESDGDQNARNGRTGAMGLFQVTPKNVRDWTRDTFGYEMSPAEFKKDTQAQIAIFNKYMGKYLQKGLEMSKGDWNKAIRIAAVQWYGTGKGEGMGYDDPTRFQKKEPTRREYTLSVLKRTRKFLTGNDSDFDFDSAEKQNQIAERLRADAIKNRENQDRQILDIARQTASEDKSVAEKNLAEKVLSENDYRKKIEQIDLDLLAKEKQILEDRLKIAELSAEDRAKIESEIARVSSEIKIKNTENETAAIKATNEELEKQKQISEQIAEIRTKVLQSERDRLEFLSDQERKILVNELDHAKTKKQKADAETVLREFDIQRAERAKQWRIEDLNAEEETAKAKLSAKEKELGAEEELHKLYENQRLTTIEEFEAKKKEIEDSYKQKKSEFGDGFGGDILSSVFGSPEQLASVANAWTFLGNQVGGVINSMIQGVGSMVESWVLLGSSGGASIRKFTAQVLASLAAQAAVSALFELAKGFAMLFVNPAEAGAHFTAAAIFGGIAGVAAVAGRAVAGDSFKQANNQSASNQAQINSGGGSSGGRGGGSQYSSSGDNRIIDESRDRQEQPSRHEITLKMPRGFVVDSFEQDFRDRGKTYDLIVREVEG